MKSVYIPYEYFEETHRQMESIYRLQHRWVSRLTLVSLADGGVSRMFTGCLSFLGFVTFASGTLFGWQETVSTVPFPAGVLFVGVFGAVSYLFDRQVAKDTLKAIDLSNKDKKGQSN